VTSTKTSLRDYVRRSNLFQPPVGIRPCPTKKKNHAPRFHVHSKYHQRYLSSCTLLYWILSCNLDGRELMAPVVVANENDIANERRLLANFTDFPTSAVTTPALYLHDVIVDVTTCGDPPPLSPSMIVLVLTTSAVIVNVTACSRVRVLVTICRCPSRSST